MPRKSIIFPVNNKGGVGKTSLLVDLMSMLSLEYRVGLIDMDGQGSLYSTLTGDYSLVNAETSSYVGLETEVVELLRNADFRFAQGSKRLQIKISPSKTPVAIFPVGLLYDNPFTREKLERIVQKDMDKIGMIAVDLPPIPHAGLILDHSLMPVIDAAGGRDADLFPLIVVTPEKNTVDVGMNTFSQIHNYLTRKGIPENRIHPVVIVNKVAVGTDERRNFRFGSLDDHDRAKLRALGIIFSADSGKDYQSGFFEFRKGFVFEGSRYRVKWMPLIDGLRGGDFHLLYGREAGLFQFPLLYRVAVDSGYFDEKMARSDVQMIYSTQMGGICSWISHHASLPRSKNYITNKQHRPKAKAQTLLVSQIKTGLMDVDQILKDRSSKDNDFYKTGDVTISYDANLLSVWMPMQKLPLETLAMAIAKSEVDLGVGIDWLNEAWKPGDYTSILNQLKSGGYGFTSYENSLMEIRTLPQEMVGMPRVGITLKLREKSYERQMGLFDEFLNHLDVALKREQKIC